MPTQYQILVSRLADLESCSGFRTAADLPTLADADVAVVTDARSQEMRDTFTIDTAVLYLHMTGTLTADHFSTRYRQLAEIAAREILLADVQDECARRAEAEEADAATERSLARPFRLPQHVAADDAGVASQFRA